LFSTLSSGVKEQSCLAQQMGAFSQQLGLTALQAAGLERDQ
jgi:hypothetical protein